MTQTRIRDRTQRRRTAAHPPSTPGTSGTAGGRDLAQADATLARRLRILTRPARTLVNQPHILVATIFAVIVGCSGAYAVIERKGPVESLWWAVVTGSTVGYGDFYPESTAGRAVATFLIVTMLVLLPIAIGHVIANLVADRNQFTHDEQISLAETTESIHDRVDRLEFLLLASLAKVHGSDWVTEQVASFDAAEAADVDVDDRMLNLFRTPED